MKSGQLIECNGENTQNKVEKLVTDTSIISPN